ncbi:MAG: hypothetical protein GXP15_00350 [Gammaproteobacteria bacterium]|nr:hypothetical protein [Gammaproteobacteria bacterium]
MTTSCCAIALQGKNAATANMLAVRANQAIGGFLVIVTVPVMMLEPVDYNENFPESGIFNGYMQTLESDRRTSLNSRVATVRLYWHLYYSTNANHDMGV